MDRCKSPRNSVNKVTGKSEISLCVFNRSDGYPSTRCGPEGLWFEQNVIVVEEPTKPKRRLLTFFGFDY